jgi:hypothetical protein
MVENSYVPVFPTDNYNKQQSVKKNKDLSLKDLGLKSDPKGGLTIDDPTAFISGLGLSDAYANNLMTSGIEFKDFDEFQNFINTAVESGNTTKSDDFYNDIFAEDARLEKDSRIQTSSSGRGEASQAAADKAFGIKRQPAAPTPQNQAQAGRPNLDQPDTGKSAFARAAARTMPDFVNRLGGNGRFANQAKLQMMQEAKRRQQNEIADLKKSEKARKRAGEVDEILNAKNDQYRQLYANTPDAEGNKRSAEDWDAMDRDQKIKLIQNYNINRSLGAPAGEITGQKMNAQVAPRGSMEDLTTPRQFNEVTQSFEIPQDPRQFDSSRNTFRTPTEVLGQNLPEISPESFEPQVRTPESPDIDMEGIQSQVDAGMDEAMRTRRRQKPEIPSGAVHTRHPNVPKESHTGIYATNPGVQQRAFDLQLENDIKNTIPYENNIADSKSTKVTPPPGVTVKPEPEGDLLGSLTPAANNAFNVSKNFFNDLVEDKQAPQAPAPQAPAPQAPAPQAPAQPSKLPAADPFLQDEPAEEMQGPKEKMVPIYGSDGIVGYRSYSDQRKAAQDYAKKEMRNSPFSSLGNAYSGRMSKLYPTLNTDRLKKEVDQETADYYSKNNPFGEEYRPKGKRYNPFS